MIKEKDLGLLTFVTGYAGTLKPLRKGRIDKDELDNIDEGAFGISENITMMLKINLIFLKV